MTDNQQQVCQDSYEERQLECENERGRGQVSLVAFKSLEHVVVQTLDVVGGLVISPGSTE